MSETQAPVKVKGGLVAYLNVDGAIAAAEFYVKAFGGEIASQIPPDAQGRSMHVHAYIQGTSLMLSAFYPEHGHPKVESQGFLLMLPIENDIHARFQRAVDAGCTVVQPVEKMFWGDLYGALKDPWGVSWAMNQQA